MLTIAELKQDLKEYINHDKAEFFPRFFKTQEGEYGYGDKFLGITVPDCRIIAKKYKDLELNKVEELLHSGWHEERLIALLILVIKFSKAEEYTKEQIFNLYLKNTKYINNWDLVDLSAPHVVGKYLMDKPKDILYKLAKSNLIWDRRIAILSTHTFIRQKEYTETFKIAEILLKDTQDLIHKAVGWMLREVGRKSGHDIEEDFLKKHYKIMPRTMLRYSIEHFSPEKKAYYMAK